MAIVFDLPSSRIVITAPQAQVTIQNLVNAIRDFEDEFSTMSAGAIIRTSGKQNLGGGLNVGITLELLSPWVIDFDLFGTSNTLVSGGNLIGIEADGITPGRDVFSVPAAALAQSASATLLNEDTIKLIASHLLGGREIDFVGSDAAGWQRVQRDELGAVIQRYNLFNQANVRITGTVASFISAQSMIAKETPAP